jgi:hypothetical protein
MTVEIFDKVKILQSEKPREFDSLVYYPAIVSDYKNKQRIEACKKNIKSFYGSEEPIEEEIDNEPIDNIRYINRDWKDVGNANEKSYKVMLPSKQVVDLSEEMMHVILTTVGISEGGILNGEYVFGKVGSDTTLILVGSNFYNSGMERKKFKTKESVVSDPVTGKIYKIKNNQLVLYCGKVFTKTLKNKTVNRHLCLGLKKDLRQFTNEINRLLAETLNKETEEFCDRIFNEAVFSPSTSLLEVDMKSYKIQNENLVEIIEILKSFYIEESKENGWKSCKNQMKNNQDRKNWKPGCNNTSQYFGSFIESNPYRYHTEERVYKTFKENFEKMCLHLNKNKFEYYNKHIENFHKDYIKNPELLDKNSNWLTLDVNE